MSLSGRNVGFRCRSLSWGGHSRFGLVLMGLRLPVKWSGFSGSPRAALARSFPNGGCFKDIFLPVQCTIREEDSDGVPWRGSGVAEHYWRRVLLRDCLTNFWLRLGSSGLAYSCGLWCTQWVCGLCMVKCLLPALF